MTPNTTVTLYATPFDISNKYVVKVDSEAEAYGIVSSFPSKKFTNCYWQRNYRAFRANGNINDLQVYNYCTFENNGKINFAFITSFEYHNDVYTDVNIELDFWLNYAGQYTFNPSPMRRAHPVNDFYFDSMEAEPFSVSTFVPNSVHESNIPTGVISDFVHVITTVNALTFENQASSYWDAVAKLFTGEGNQFGTLLNELKTTPCICDGVIQGNTSICNSEFLQRLLESFEKAGRLDCVVAAYRIPYAARLMGLQAFDYPELARRVDTFEITRGFTQTVTNWNKIKYSPQFNHIVVNNGGNLKEYSIAIAQKTDDTLLFVASSNQSQHGCCTIICSDYTNRSESSVFSPSWDSVQIVGAGTERAAAVKNFANLIPSAINVMNAVNPLSMNVDRGLSAAENVTNTVFNYLNNGAQSIQGQGYLIGNTSDSLTAYCMMNPLYTCAWYVPTNSDLKRLNDMFSLYGYTYDGELHSIEFNMPIWNYYETQEANITGASVPQWALAKCISRFNTGIFVFKNIAQYKDFSLIPLNHIV